MTDDPDIQEQIEEAAQGPGHEFHGIPLKPFSFGHNACWQRMGFGRMESSFESLIAVVFLCTKGKRDLNRCRGPERIEAMQDELWDWGELHKIKGDSESGIECFELGHKIWQEMSLSRFTIDGKGKEGPND